MEAFPVQASQHHPAHTPPARTGPLPAPHHPNPTMNPSGGYGAPPGFQTPPPGYPVPQGGYQTPAANPAVSSSGMYDPSASYVGPKKSKAGLIVAIVAVLVVGGGAAAFLVLDSKKST